MSKRRVTVFTDAMQYSSVKTSGSSPEDGYMMKVFGVTEEGKKVMIKRCPPKNALGEWFGYVLATRLGLTCNEVRIMPDVSSIWEDSEECVGTVQTWEDKLVLRRNASQNITLAKRTEQQEKFMQFFDYVIYNNDRHAWNWGFVGKHVFLFDHGEIKPWDTDAYDYRLRHFRDLLDRGRVPKSIMNRFLSIEDDEWDLMFGAMPGKLQNAVSDLIPAIKMRMNMLKTIIRHTLEASEQVAA